MLNQQEKLNPPLLGRLGALWGLFGFTLLIFNALYRLSPWAIEVISQGLSSFQWVVMVAWVVFMAVSEGYRGFQKNFSPRFASRALWLSQNPQPLSVLLAPLFCMGFFGATRKRKIVTWCLSLGIIGLIMGVRMLSQPWRGIIDAGVVVGLAWGLLSLWVFMVQYFFTQAEPVDPEIE